MRSARRSAAALAAALLALGAAGPTAAQSVGGTYRVGDASGGGGTTMSALYAALDGYCRVVAKLRKTPHPGTLSPAQIHQLVPVIDFLRDGARVQVVHGPSSLPCVHGPAYFSVRVLDGHATFGATTGWINGMNLVAPPH
jgi:hypothetical protein